MRKRDELTDPRSCMSRAREDEWTFVLLGRDAAAPAAVREWIDERLRLGKNKGDDPQIEEARRWIIAVEAEHDSRRLELAEKKAAGGLSGGEAGEFAALQDAFFERVTTAARRRDLADLRRRVDEIEARLSRGGPAPEEGVKP